MVGMEHQPEKNTSLFQLLRSPHLATVTVLLLAYALAYVDYVLDSNSPSGAPYPFSRVILATALGVVYLYLLVADEPLPLSLFGASSKMLRFGTLTALMIAIQFLMPGANGIWLVPMPLVAMATTDIEGLWRWLIYGAALFAMAGPIYLVTDNLETALSASFLFFPAVVFVAIFARLTEKAELAQQEAEQLTRQLETANDQLADFALQAEELATMQERNRLAREIHDNLGHYLTVVNMQIKAAEAVMDRDPEAARATLDKARQQTEDGLAAIRHSVAALRESPLGNRTLSDAIGALLRDIESLGLLVNYQVAGAARGLSPAQELTLFRAVQETMTNVRRHAEASRVDVLLDYSQPEIVRLTVRDNGIGVDMTTHKPGFGLIGLRERTRQLHGHLAIASQPGSGFTVEMTLPTEQGERSPSDREISQEAHV